MISVWSIAVQTVRAAIRSRVAVLIAGLQILALALFPFVIRSDGTIEGQVKLLLTYSLAVSALLLGLMALWLGAGGFSQEIEGKQLRLVMVKPVSVWRVWIGKWLGLAFIAALLVALSGLLMYATLFRTFREFQRSAPEEVQGVADRILSSRRMYAPNDSTLKAHAKQRLVTLRAAGADESLSDEALLANIERELLRIPLGVPPGGATGWEFESVSASNDGKPLFLQLHFTGFGIRRPVAGRWSVQWRGGEPFHYTRPLNMRQTHEIAIPASYHVEGAPLRVAFENAADEEATTVLFEDWGGVALLSVVGSFAGNVFRTLLCLWFYVIMLGALGLALGGVFSFPVAVFAVFSVMLMAPLARYAAATRGAPEHRHVHADECEPAGCEDRSWMQPVFDGLTSAMNVVVDGVNLAVSPVFVYWPISRLPDGIEVSWRRVAESAAALCALYAGVFFLLSACVLKKRELALHER